MHSHNTTPHTISIEAAHTSLRGAIAEASAALPSHPHMPLFEDVYSGRFPDEIEALLRGPMDTADEVLEHSANYATLNPLGYYGLQATRLLATEQVILPHAISRRPSRNGNKLRPMIQQGALAVATGIMRDIHDLPSDDLVDSVALDKFTLLALMNRGDSNAIAMPDSHIGETRPTALGIYAYRDKIRSGRLLTVMHEAFATHTELIARRSNGKMSQTRLSHDTMAELPAILIKEDDGEQLDHSEQEVLNIAVTSIAVVRDMAKSHKKPTKLF